MNRRVDQADLAERLEELSISTIIPDPQQPRRHFDEDEIAILATSIKNVGFVHPIVVRHPDQHGRFKLVVGERRWRAAQRLGLQTIPAIIRAYSDQEAYLEMQLAENLPGYRVEWDLRERAEALRRFINSLPTMECAAERLGRSPAWLSQMVAVLELPPAIRSLLDRNIVRDRMTLLSLKSLADKDEKAANELIHKANVDKKLARGDVLQYLARANTTTSMAPKEDAVYPKIYERQRVEKIRKVSKLLGLPEDAPTEMVLDRLVDDFLTRNGMERGFTEQIHLPYGHA